MQRSWQGLHQSRLAYLDGLSVARGNFARRPVSLRTTWRILMSYPCQDVPKFARWPVGLATSQILVGCPWQDVPMACGRPGHLASFDGLSIGMCKSYKDLEACPTY